MNKKRIIEAYRILEELNDTHEKMCEDFFFLEKLVVDGRNALLEEIQYLERSDNLDNIIKLCHTGK